MRWPWTIDPEVCAAVAGSVAEPPPVLGSDGIMRPAPPIGAWRIEKDPHEEKFYAQQYGLHFGKLNSATGYHPLQNYGPWWCAKHTANTEADARAWIEREKLRPIIVAEIAP